ncbi:catalase [Rubellimicrobium roseum]|uniref:catalase n=1 Tax=Rubellimicrobium roseum TaxID=687525 RepID=UPI001FE58E5D|nr:catalase [Rubellimicrobium roseum]
MTSTVSAPPRSPAADLERPAPDEAETIATLDAAMRRIQETTLKDYGHALRSVHAKSHGLIEGEMRVPGGLPPELAQGLFARPGTYRVVMRLSTNPGDVLDDTVSAPRGMAIKVMGVEGERLPGSEGGRTQDFVMANAPAFAAPDPKAFAGNLSLLAATTDTGQGWKKGLSATLRGAEAAVEAMGSKSPTLTTLGGQPITHPLGETFYTQTPFLYGDHVAKLSLAPVSPGLVALTGQPVDVQGRPNGLREAVIDVFREQDAEWELRVQLRTKAETMPIEDASVPWPEEESPYVAVARITAPRQPAWSEARARQVDDGLAFSPWHGLAAHQPLGGINRARRGTYDNAARFRSQRNGCPIAEPSRGLRLVDEPAMTYGTAPGREGRRPGTPDARDGAWGQPVNDTMRHAVAGAAGGLAAGLLLSGVIAGMGAAQGRASELVTLERRTLGRPEHPDRSGSAREEALGHGGHLALSALAGAGYGAVHKGEGSPVAAGLAFGVGFWALAYGVVGPALGVTPRPWRDEPANLAQHALLHAVFGVATALAADRVAPPLRARSPASRPAPGRKGRSCVR